MLGAARVSFGDSKLGIDEVRDVVYAADISPGAVAVDWAEAVKLDLQTGQLRAAADSGATYEEVPAAGLQAKNYASWNKDFARWLSQAEKLDLMRQRDLKLTSNPGETERDFQARVRDAQRVARDAAVDDLRKKFAARRGQIEDQRRRAQSAIERESSQATQQKLQTGLSVGATILGALFGRKAIGAGTIGRATTAARGVSRISKEKQDVKRAQETVEVKQQALADLDAQIADETAAIAAQFDADASNLETISLAPKRGGVLVQSVALGWKSS